MSMDSAEWTVWQLIKQSDAFLVRARACVTTTAPLTTTRERVISDINVDGDAINDYNLLVKASLNCLFKVIRHFSGVLDANMNAVVCMKTAKILYNETISLDLASEYCTKGIQICKRSSNDPLLLVTKLKLHYLNFQIQTKNLSVSTFPTLQADLNNIIKNEIPSEDSFSQVRLFFEFIKFQYFNRMYNYEKNIAHLNFMLSQALSMVDQSLDILKLQQLIHINTLIIQILNNEHHDKIALTRERMKYLHKKLPPDSTSSFQLEAMLLLSDILISLDHHDTSNLNQKLLNMDVFIKSVKAAKSVKTNKNVWTTSKITYTLKLKNTSSFSFQITWLTFKEFVIISYFYLAVLCSLKSWDRKGKSDKLFKLTNSLLDDPSLFSGADASSSLFERQKHNIRLNYIRILTSIYQLISDLVKDQYPQKEDISILSNYKQLSTFLVQYEAKQYTDYELTIYHNLIPLIYYLRGIIHQRHGQFHAALKFYMLARQQTKNRLGGNDINKESLFASLVVHESVGLLDPFTHFEQYSVNFQQIYLLCTLNMIPVVELTIEQEKKNQRTMSEFDITYDKTMANFKSLLKLKDTIHGELLHFSNTQKSEWEGLNVPLLSLTIASLRFFYDSANDSGEQILNMKLTNNERIANISPMLMSLIYLLKGVSYKADPGLTELENMNKKVGLLTSACQNAIMASSKSGITVNAIARLGYYEIWKFMNNNKNSYSEDNIRHIYEKLKYFNDDFEEEKKEEVIDVPERSVKRVKFL